MAVPTAAEIGEARAVASGAISRAPLGTALPTDATTALIAAFKGLGYVGNDGIQRTRDVSVDPVRDMNGDTVYNLQTEFSRTYQAELLQYDNVDIKKMIYGDANVTATAGSPTNGARISVVDKGEPSTHAIYSIDTYRIGPSGVTEKSRIVLGDAQVTAVEEGPLRAGAVRSYTLTWTVFKDSSGNYIHEYDDDGVLVP